MSIETNNNVIADADHPRVGLFIDGEWIFDRPSCFEVLDPSTEASLTSVPGATTADLKRVLAAAERGFKIWRDTPPAERNIIISRAIAGVHARSEEIAQIITRENGKLIADARAEVERSASFFDWDMAQALRAYGTIVPGEAQMQKSILRQPIGPVAAFTPWNVPLSAPSRKISGALCAGCSIILKAPEETPGAAVAMVQCFEQAGLPKGVLNLVFGNPALVSSTLIESPVTRMVTLTGSVAVGKHLSQLAGAAMKPVLMELGGHAPVIVCEGVNAAEIGKMALKSKIRINAQWCAAPGRFLVHESIYDEFVAAFVATADQVRVADGMDTKADMGPVTSARRLVAMQHFVDDALVRGGKVAVGGHRVGERGYYFAPTLLVDTPLDCAIMTDEPFGPVAVAVRFSTLDEAIEISNSLSVGLAAFAFTNSLEEAERLSRELDVGVLSINHFGAPDPDTPFGGVKDSGIGREGGPWSLDSYMVSKTVLQKTARV
ncbi:NAD-dependent succinate-semialdehyde dehydrogenase [Pseudomonas sp. GL-R-19]|uniref:NAD-dependent succinate-semialdehyde dehydrogenase n=1 Tax=Pseudomonas sp. GL-R-19 TaxID=2832391 RepID=UPI001CBD4047|nr:NAD-dependent succinate-semialdehyde dehydrogenase [Pseudomonas sp. GL-R-19]